MFVVAKQPILDKTGKEVAYELLNRGKDKRTQEILYLLVNDIDFTERIEGKLSFINLDKETLLDNTVTLLDPQKVVLEILETVDLGEEGVLARLWELKEKGYKLALDDFVCTQENYQKYEPYLPLFDIVKVEVDESCCKSSFGNVIDRLQEVGAKLLAEKVESVDQFSELKKYGFDYFQGYFFARPYEQKEQKVDNSKIDILNVLQLIDRGAELDELEAAFKRNPRLSIDLLKYINSPYFGLAREIESIRYAINLIGPIRLKQWLLLMLYAIGDADPVRNPLYDLVSSRARFISFLAIELGKDEEEGYFVGLLSAADVILKMPMKRVLERIKVSSAVQEALLEKKGLYGELLKLSMAHEVGNEAAVRNILQSLGLSEEQLASAALAAI